MTTNDSITMNIKRKIKTVTRIFTRPKDWKAKGNMEFDELLLLALFHKEVAEKEICNRFNHWYREYCALRIAITTIAAPLFALVIISCAEWHDITLLCISAVLASLLITCMYLMQRRARAIDDKLLHCYYWIIAEVLRPNNNVEYEHKNIEDVFIRKLPALEKQERKAERKFKRLVRSFGYTEETISN